MGRKIPEKITEAARLCYGECGMEKPDGCQPLTGDSDETNVEDMLAVSAILLAKEGKKEAEVLKGCAGQYPDYESIWDLRREGAEIYERILGRVPQQTNFMLEESGNYYVRNNWERNGEYLHLERLPGRRTRT